MSDVAKEMPKYQRHEKVRALKIDDIVRQHLGATLHFCEEGFAPVKMSPEWVRMHRPMLGGYYVVHEDGHASYSPAEAFENGYAKI